MKGRPEDPELEEAVQRVYDENRSVYGQRKIKHALRRQGLLVSRRRMGRIMKKRRLVSAYTKTKYRHHSSTSNETITPNLLNREFDGHAPESCVVSDLTYVHVGRKWAYICLLLDLGAREIIGFSSGGRKDAVLIRKAFSTVKTNLLEMQMFHTDQGSEYDNQLIDDILAAFQIERSLSMKSCPYDNAVAESTFKMIKAEFVYRRHFRRLSSYSWSYPTMFTGSIISVSIAH